MKRKILFFVILNVFTFIIFFHSFSSGFLFNDYNVLHRLKEKGFSLNYFSTIKNENHVKELRDKGLIPFYTHDKVKLNFFRPVASVFIFLQYSVLKEKAVYYRIINFLLLLLCGFLLFYFLLQISEPIIAYTATALFVIGKTNTALLNVVFSQDELLSLIFTLSAIIFYVKYHNNGKTSALFTTLLFCLTALLTKENGIYSIVFIFALDLMVLRKGNIKERLIKQRMAFALLFMIASVYVIFYLLSGYGANSLEYITPLTPVRYMQYFIRSFIMNFLSLFLYTPQKLFSPNPFPLFSSLTLVSMFLMLVILIGLFVVLKKNKLFRFFFFWLAAPLLLAVGYNPSEKMLFYSSIGYSVLFALICRDFIKRVQTGFLKTQIRSFTFFLISVFILASPVYSFFVMGRYKYIGTLYQREINSIQRAMGSSFLSWRKLIIGLNHRNKFTLDGFHSALFVQLELNYINLHFLNVNSMVRVSRPDDNTITLESYFNRGESLFGTGAPHELAYLLDMNFYEGQKFETEHYTVYILKMENGLPVKISVTTRLKVSDDGLLFLRYNILSNAYEIKSFTPEGLFR